MSRALGFLHACAHYLSSCFPSQGSSLGAGLCSPRQSGELECVFRHAFSVVLDCIVEVLNTLSLCARFSRARPAAVASVHVRGRCALRKFLIHHPCAAPRCFRFPLPPSCPLRMPGKGLWPSEGHWISPDDVKKSHCTAPFTCFACRLPTA